MIFLDENPPHANPLRGRHVAVEVVEGGGEDPMMLSMRFSHRLLVGLPETGAPFDIREEKRDRALRKLGSHDAA